MSETKYMAKKDRAIKEGLCINCMRRELAPGRLSCPQCLEYKKLNLKFGDSQRYKDIYSDLFEKQLGFCAICKKELIRPVMDHCHKTLEVRGLLCGRCNVGLGYFSDDAELILKAAQYIKFSRTGLFYKKGPSKSGPKKGSKRSPLNSLRPNKGGFIVLD